MEQLLKDIGINATAEEAWIYVIVAALMAVLYIALIVCFFVITARTRKLKKMDKKLAELIEINKQLLAAVQKKEHAPMPPMFPMPQMPHMGSSWRRR